MVKGHETCPRFLQRLAKTDDLITDDLGLAEITAQDARDLLGMLYDRAPSQSTIVADQFPLVPWHEALEHPTAPDAIFDSWEYASMVLRGQIGAQSRLYWVYLCSQHSYDPRVVLAAQIMRLEKCYMY